MASLHAVLGCSEAVVENEASSIPTTETIREGTSHGRQPSRRGVSKLRERRRSKAFKTLFCGIRHTREGIDHGRQPVQAGGEHWERMAMLMGSFRKDNRKAESAGREPRRHCYKKEDWDNGQAPELEGRHCCPEQAANHC